MLHLSDIGRVPPRRLHRTDVGRKAIPHQEEGKVLTQLIDLCLLIRERVDKRQLVRFIGDCQLRISREINPIELVIQGPAFLSRQSIVDRHYPDASLL